MTTWDVGSRTRGWYVYRGGTRVATILASAGAGHTFSGLSCGTTYVLGVEAYNQQVTSARATLNATTAACGAAPACSDGADNDADGKTDYPADPGCSSATDSDETDAPTSPACSDGVDNDADGKTDYPADPGCTSATDSDETNAPSGEPTAIAGQGYSIKFSDEFDAFNANVWTRSVWYEPPAAAGDIYTQSGILHLVSRRSSGYPNVTVTTLNSQPAFRRGYFEARMRWTKGAGSWPAFWLFSTARASGNVVSPEIDVFEGQGVEPNVFYGTIHRNSSNCCSMPNQWNSNNYHSVGVDLTAGFHTYGVLWTTTTVSWYLDDVFLMSAPVFDTTDNDMFMLLQMWTGGWTGDTDATTPSELHTEVDWVRAWQGP